MGRFLDRLQFKFSNMHRFRVIGPPDEKSLSVDQYCEVCGEKSRKRMPPCEKRAFDELTQQHVRETGFLPGKGEAKGDPIEAYVCPGCEGKDSAQCKKCKSKLNKSRKRRGLKKKSEAEHLILRPQGIPTQVIKNPSSRDIEFLKRQHLGEYPMARKDLDIGFYVRFTYDSAGNTYAWDAGKSLHEPVEELLRLRFRDVQFGLEYA